MNIALVHRVHFPTGEIRDLEAPPENFPIFDGERFAVKDVSSADHNASGNVWNPRPVRIIQHNLRYLTPAEAARFTPKPARAIERQYSVSRLSPRYRTCVRTGVDLAADHGDRTWAVFVTEGAGCGFLSRAAAMEEIGDLATMIETFYASAGVTQ